MKPKTILIFFLLFNVVELTAQIDNSFFTGAKKGHVDTLGIETGKIATKESEGLMEKEVDPDKYIVGPGDEFTISIITPKPIEFTADISPDGRMLIRGAGVVDLKDKTLAESYDIIKSQIKQVYNSKEVFILLNNIRKFKVIVSGAVQRASIVSATAMERVSEVIEKAGGLKFESSLRNISLLRTSNNKVLPVDLVKFYLTGDENSNPYVLGGDKIIVPESSDNLTISINGEVASPNIFEYVKGDSLSTLIKFGQGFLASSFLDSVEVAKFTRDGKQLEIEYLNLNDWKGRLFTVAHLPGDFPLEPGDRVYIRKKDKWKEQHYAVVKGEVRYPGYYAISENKETVRDLIFRAGGFTEYASLETTEFIRQEQLDIKDPEMERLEKLPPSEMSEDEIKYFQARVREKKGIMAINFENLLNDPNSNDNITLHNKDSIVVAKKNDYINVQGRVTYPGQVKFNPNYKYEDYIALAGGYGYRADESETLISKPFGGLFLAEDDKKYNLEPGDVILVPPKKDLSWGEVFLTGFTVVSQIVAIVGVVVAVTK